MSHIFRVRRFVGAIVLPSTRILTINLLAGRWLHEIAVTLGTFPEEFIAVLPELLAELPVQRVKRILGLPIFIIVFVVVVARSGL
jgi:hypothetical protein